MFAQNILFAKSAHPITLSSPRDVLEILRSLIYFSTSLPLWISTSAAEKTQTDAHDLLPLPTCLSLYHGSLLSHETTLPLAFEYHHVVSISDTLVTILNDILSHILYDWFALVPYFQYTNSSSIGEFIPDHRSAHSSLLK